MTPKSRAWQDLDAAWRGADWSGCAEKLRPMVEELPEVLSTRLLLAAFAARAGNPGLALLHYEKLMVLAVGQGELFHALAAERGLSGVESDESAHRKRLQALQQWFRTMPRRSRGRGGAAFPHSWLVDLPPDEFRRHTEASRVEVLPPSPQVLDGAPGVFAIVLHGEVRWSYEPSSGGPLPAAFAGTGDVIAPPGGCESGDRVNLEAVEPAVILLFDPSVAATLRDRAAGAAPASRPASEPAEPVSAGASDRRREHELIVHFERGTAELGVAGTRTGPIAGRLAELSSAGLTFSVPRATVLQSRAALEGAHVVTRMVLPGADEPLRLAARVTSLTFEKGSLAGDPLAQIAVEFVLLLAPDRARLQEALAEATRTGRWPWTRETPPEESRPAA